MPRQVRRQIAGTIEVRMISRSDLISERLIHGHRKAHIAILVRSCGHGNSSIAGSTADLTVGEAPSPPTPAARPPPLSERVLKMPAATDVLVIGVAMAWFQISEAARITTHFA